LASKDGIDGVGIKLFKLHANLPQREIYMFFNILRQTPKSSAAVNPHPKFAVRLFLEWRFAYFLCAAQGMSKCPKMNWWGQQELRRKNVFNTLVAQPAP